MRAASAATLVAVLGVTLAGCGDDPEPQFAPPPSSSPSAATDSPSASADADPQPWEEKTPEGAVAFAKHWTATFNEAAFSGDTAELATLSTSDCSSCQSLVSFIDEVYSSGGQISGEAWTLRQPNYSSPDSGKTVGVAGVMQIPEQTVTRGGADEETSAPLTADYFFTISWRDQRWIVEAIETES